MFEITTAVVIGRRAADVFAYYVDPGNRPQWSDHVLDGRWLTDGPISVGSIFQITIRQWGRTVTTVREITLLERNRQLCYTMDTGGLRISSCQTFEPAGDGTRFSIQASYQFRHVMQLFEPLFKRHQTRHLAEEATNLKRALENGRVAVAGNQRLS